MTNYPFSKLSSSCSVSVRLFLKHSNLPALLPSPSRAIYTFWIKPALCISQPFRGCIDETHCFPSFPSELRVDRSLNILKDDVFYNHFHLYQSIVMMEGDRLSFTQEGMVHFSGQRVASPWPVSSNTTLIYNFAKKWMWESFFFFFLFPLGN